MKQEDAERLAAADGGVPIEQAKSIIDSFLVEIARCPACDGTGEFNFRADVTTKVRDDIRAPNAEPESVTVEADTITTCPLCGDGRGDPEFVAWHCTEGAGQRICSAEGSPDGHTECGLRVMLPTAKAE